MIKMKDSDGNHSQTLGLVKIAFFVGTAAFIYSTYHTHTADLVGYGAFVFGSVLPWLGREYLKGKKNDTNAS